MFVRSWASANLCYEVSERDGAEKCGQAIRENADFARWAKEQDDDMIKAMFGGHALFTISDKTFEQMVKANDGMTGFHIHVAEGMNDVYDSLRNYGCRPVNPFLFYGVVGGRPCWATASISPPRWTFRRRAPWCATTRNPTWATRWAARRCSSCSRRASSSAWAPTPTPTTCWRA